MDKHNKPVKELTKREREILELAAVGLNYKEIAERLFISPETVRKHLRNIYAKLNVTNKVAAINKIRH